MDKVNSPASPAILEEFVGVMGKLKAIIENENDFLERGLPAALLATTRRKSTLSRQYGVLGQELLDAEVERLLNDPNLSATLLAAGAELQTMGEENRKLMQRAVRATKRRVDAVMEAVKANAADSEN